MAFETPRSRLNIRQIRNEKQHIPIDQIIAIEGHSPIATGISTAGNVIGQALMRRAQLRQEGERLARMEALANLGQGSLSGLDPQGMALPLTMQRIKQQADAQEEAQRLSQNMLKVRALEKQFGYKEGSLGDDYASAVMRVQGEVADTRAQRKEELKNLQKSGRDLDTYTDTAAKALQAIGKIRGAAANLPEFGPGGLSQAVGKGVMAYKSFAKDPATATYEGYVSQELIPLARSLAEEKGPITDLDVARIEKGLGDRTTPPGIRAQLLNELVNKVELGVQNKAQTSGKDLGEVLSRNTSLADLLQQQKSFQEPGLPTLTGPQPVAITPKKVGKYKIIGVRQ